MGGGVVIMPLFLSYTFFIGSLSFPFSTFDGSGLKARWERPIPLSAFFTEAGLTIFLICINQTCWETISLTAGFESEM